MHETWAQGCDKYLFITKFLNETLNSSVESIDNEFGLPLLQPSNLKQDNYDDLTTKVYRTFADVYLNYNNYDWYLKADDDTYFRMENLREFLMDKNSLEPVTYGNYKLLG